MTRRWGLALFGAAWLGSIVALSCNSTVHVFEGDQYLPAGCLSAGEVLAVVNGGTISTGCDPVCLVYPDDAGIKGTDTYISTQCGPYPYTIDAGPGECAEAFAALEAGYYCINDGEAPSGDAPVVASDAGSDAPSPPDATVPDAGTDAGSDGAADATSANDASTDDAGSTDSGSTDGGTG